MNVKVFLKFNRTDASAQLCLMYWLEVFKHYDTYVLCDLYNVEHDNMPKYLQRALQGYQAKVINTHYGNSNFHQFKAKKKKMAAANKQCFVTGKDADLIWVIDADDTMFLTREFDGIQEKLRKAEHYMVENSLDGFSLDFYREYNDTWTFGVACFRPELDWDYPQQNFTAFDIDAYGLPRNIDSMFDMMCRKGMWKLKSFVFTGYGFQHLINNFPDLVDGIYYWHPGHLWDRPLHPDVIEL